MNYNKKIKVLVLDDSAVVRQAIKEMLKDHPKIEVVATAISAEFAAKKIIDLKPDVLLLDINLPGIDGLTFLEKIMSQKPMPVIIFSSYAKEGSQNAIKALELGAIEIIDKPKLTTFDQIKAYKKTLERAIINAAKAKPISQKHLKNLKTTSTQIIPHFTPKLIAIGASTGGTEIISLILKELIPPTPPIIIAQHMPAHFTKLFAQRLDQLAKIQVKEAQNFSQLEENLALLAPGNYHITITMQNAKLFTKLIDDKPINFVKPSINLLFKSIANIIGNHTIGIILTGMGNDGAEGLLAIKKAGGLTIAQDETTSVIFSMPKSAIEIGAAKYVLPAPEIPKFLNSIIHRSN